MRDIEGSKLERDAIKGSVAVTTEFPGLPKIGDTVQAAPRTVVKIEPTDYDVKVIWSDGHVDTHSKTELALPKLPSGQHWVGGLARDIRTGTDVHYLTDQQRERSIEAEATRRRREQELEDLKTATLTPQQKALGLYRDPCGVLRDPRRGKTLAIGVYPAGEQSSETDMVRKRVGLDVPNVRTDRIPEIGGGVFGRQVEMR